MHKIRAKAASVLLSAALLASGPAQAMEIREYDRMAAGDRGEYVTDLILGAEKVLRDEGKPEFADKVHKLFTEIRPGDKITVGIGELEINLALARVSDAKDHEVKPADPWLEVEDVLAVTLKKNHIELPDSFFTVARGFRPKYPPQH